MKKSIITRGEQYRAVINQRAREIELNEAEPVFSIPLTDSETDSDCGENDPLYLDELTEEQRKYKDNKFEINVLTANFLKNYESDTELVREAILKMKEYLDYSQEKSMQNKTKETRKLILQKLDRAIGEVRTNGYDKALLKALKDANEVFTKIKARDKTHSQLFSSVKNIRNGVVDGDIEIMTRTTKELKDSVNELKIMLSQVLAKLPDNDNRPNLG